MSRNHKLYFLISFLFLTLFSCKKDKVDVPDSPGIGTTWTYQYKTFISTGLLSTNIVKYKATSEEVLGGEKWLNITDSTGATFFLLKMKDDGLYQYANNASNLFCKDPALNNDQYSSYNAGGPENFTVTQVAQPLTVPFGAVNINKYEGEKLGNVMDVIWYSKDLWIAKMEGFAENRLTGIVTRVKRWELMSIEY